MANDNGGRCPYHGCINNNYLRYVHQDPQLGGSVAPSETNNPAVPGLYLNPLYYRSPMQYQRVSSYLANHQYELERRRRLHEAMAAPAEPGSGRRVLDGLDLSSHNRAGQYYYANSLLSLAPPPPPPPPPPLPAARMVEAWTLLNNGEGHASPPVVDYLGTARLRYPSEDSERTITDPLATGSRPVAGGLSKASVGELPSDDSERTITAPYMKANQQQVEQGDGAESVNLELTLGRGDIDLTLRL